MIVCRCVLRQFESPQEDEFALINLCGLSPYMGALFGRSYEKYVSAGHQSLPPTHATYLTNPPLLSHSGPC